MSPLPIAGHPGISYKPAIAMSVSPPYTLAFGGYQVQGTIKADRDSLRAITAIECSFR